MSDTGGVQSGNAMRLTSRPLTTQPVEEVGMATKQSTCIRHGYSKTKAYGAWKTMRARCLNSATLYYFNYGGRGIKVCERWSDYRNFLADMGERPVGMTLDRIDNDGDYSPENCRWATRIEQMNNSRINRLITVNGVRLTVAQASRRTGIATTVIHRRLGLGWPEEMAATRAVMR